MPAPLPRRLSETGPLGPLKAWLNQLLEYVRSLTPRASDGTLLTHAPGGVTRRAFQSSGGDGSASGYVRQVMVKDFTSHPEKMRCVFYDARTEEEGEEVWVARPTKLRGWIESAVVDSITWVYTYTDGHSVRTSTALGYAERQVIVPRYNANDVIYIGELHDDDRLKLRAADGTVYENADQPKWVDLNVDGRAWARSAVQ